MTTTKIFATADIISATGPLVSPRLPDAVYEVLNHMTGESLLTHVLPRASEVMSPELHRQLPWLRDALDMLGDYSTVPAGQRAAVVAQDVAMIVGRHGSEHAIESAEHLWRRQNPVGELAEMIGADRVAVVVMDDHPHH